MKERDIRSQLQESIIDVEAVLCAVAKAKRCKTRGRRGPLDLLADEPALQEFLKGAMLEIAGTMAINGCPPAVTGAVYREAAFLLAVTFHAVSQAHRDLFDDLLPSADEQTEPTSPKTDQAPPTAPKTEDTTSRSPKKESKP